jgi:hypothetical protein
LLNLSWMNIQGLHNKPKAEVHPGYLLTGPKYEEEEFHVEVVSTYYGQFCYLSSY